MAAKRRLGNGLEASVAIRSRTTTGSTGMAGACRGVASSDEGAALITGGWDRFQLMESADAKVGSACRADTGTEGPRFQRMARWS